MQLRRPLDRARRVRLRRDDGFSRPFRLVDRRSGPSAAALYLERRDGGRGRRHHPPSGRNAAGPADLDGPLADAPAGRIPGPDRAAGPGMAAGAERQRVRAREPSGRPVRRGGGRETRGLRRGPVDGADPRVVLRGALLVGNAPRESRGSADPRASRARRRPPSHAAARPSGSLAERRSREADGGAPREPPGAPGGRTARSRSWRGATR